MIKVIISGYGRMGHMIEKELQARGIELVEASANITATDPSVARECVCIDFTTPDAFRANYPFIARHFKAAVVGTTGWNDIACEVKKCFEENGTTLVHSANFSLGVNALFAAVAKASALLKDAGYTPEIEEIHHIHKLDKPSGTAKTLAEDIRNTGTAVCRNIPIEFIREGEVPGTHEVKWDSEEDTIIITHVAKGRRGFALGAVLAAEEICNHE
jgi:4-hydroxy-tetrahydrodipicolinate reductase